MLMWSLRGSTKDFTKDLKQSVLELCATLREHIGSDATSCIAEPFKQGCVCRLLLKMPKFDGIWSQKPMATSAF